MTNLVNRPNTALLVVDVQNGVVASAHERDAVVANVGSLVERARHEDVPVVWVQHNDEGLVRGSDEWRIVPELIPGDAEPLIETGPISRRPGGRPGRSRSATSALPNPRSLTWRSATVGRQPSP